ncbi:MAG TPA: serine/threonine-protein kinase, partial [Labilithrix sp.]|nr:serine/threonine-protein kinase [Labilithrix sp.]
MATDDRNAAPRPLKIAAPPREGIRSGVHSTRAPQTTKIATGNLVDGRYLVGEVIGTGAFGIVFEAKNVELDEQVALKTMRPEVAVDTAMVARFAREAKAAASIKSEYVATVYDVGTGADGLPYIVMEYLHGQNLCEIVEKSGPVSPQKAVEYALQICEALAVAHSKGIVHRDIKPENLLLTERAGGMHIVKVLDFGISKGALTGSIFGDQLPIVKTVNLMGTPLYMSPEQVRCSDSVDLRSDIWSLGMVLYEIIAGVAAFDGASITEICAAILEHTPTPIENYCTNLPSGLVDVITRCLEKDVRNRYQNVAELALALMPFAPKRSRLNVERAVAVLQSAGQVDPDLKVESAMPPVSVESLQAEALLRESLRGLPVNGPGLSTLASSPSSAPPRAEAKTVSAPPSSTSTMRDTAGSAAPPASKGKKTALVVAGLVVVGLAFGGGAMLRRTPQQEPIRAGADNAAGATATAPTAASTATTAAAAVTAA